MELVIEGNARSGFLPRDLGHDREEKRGGSASLYTHQGVVTQQRESFLIMINYRRCRRKRRSI